MHIQCSPTNHSLYRTLTQNFQDGCLLDIRHWSRVHRSWIWISLHILLKINFSYEEEKLGTVMIASGVSRSTTKPIKWYVRPAKTQISIGFRPVWSVFTVCMKKAWVLSYPLSAQQRLIKLGRCSGWSVSSLSAHAILLVLSWGGSFVLFVCCFFSHVYCFLLFYNNVYIIIVVRQYYVSRFHHTSLQWETTF